MQGDGIPRAWVGQDLILCRTGTEIWELVTLKEVNELGLAYAYKSGEVEGRTVFVPWASVSWMRPPVPGDLESSEA
ncbi:MAG TPA: hypothetical protein VF558_06515 [Rubrobacteraceae bacterium]